VTKSDFLRQVEESFEATSKALVEKDSEIEALKNRLKTRSNPHRNSPFPSNDESESRIYQRAVEDLSSELRAKEKEIKHLRGLIEGASFDFGHICEQEPNENEEIARIDELEEVKFRASLLLDKRWNFGTEGMFPIVKFINLVSGKHQELSNQVHGKRNTFCSRSEGSSSFGGDEISCPSDGEGIPELQLENLSPRKDNKMMPKD